MDKTRYPAMFWTPLADQKVKCELCPHDCILNPNQKGLCNVRINIEGALYTENYGHVLACGLDPIEKKPLKRFESGSMIFSIGTFGCNLACKFCQNHTLVYAQETDTITSEDQILQLASENDSIGIAFTYNEPTVWYEYVLHMAEKSHALGLKNVLVTNGYIHEAPMRKLLPYIDAMNIDLKGMTDTFYKSLCQGTLDPVLETIKLCHKFTHVEITYLLIDGLNTQDEEIQRMAQWLSKIDPKIPLHLSRYFPNYHLQLPMTEVDTIKRARAIAQKYLKYVFVGNVFI